MQEGSTKAVYGALFANIAIAVVKFVVAVVTGSSAMWSEGIHSSVDTGNQVLMLVGLRRSRRPSDPEHPFGHGNELYVWNLLVAVLIFGVGGGISAYEGILHILHPVSIHTPRWNYLVLGFAFFFEGLSLSIALRAFTGKHGDGNLIEKIVASKDPTTYTVIAEDTAALGGILLAFAGIFLSDRFHLPVFDGIASSACYSRRSPRRECRGLLVGIDRATERELRNLVRQDKLVDSVSRPLTMYLGPQNALLTLDIQIRGKASAAEVADAIERMKGRLRVHQSAVSP